jgi:hypothetical protein
MERVAVIIGGVDDQRRPAGALDPPAIASGLEQGGVGLGEQGRVSHGGPNASPAARLRRRNGLER